MRRLIPHFFASKWRANLGLAGWLTCLLGGVAPGVVAQTPELLGPPEGKITSAVQLGDGAIVTVEWTSPVDTAEDWALYVGSEQGLDDLGRITHLNARYFNDSIPETQSLKVAIPSDGKPFHIRLWWFSGDWHHKDYEFVAPNFSDATAFNAGFNDAWRNPVKKGGQGILLVVLPEIEHIFLAWFTYDLIEPAGDIDYTIGHPSQRWYTAFGPYDGDTAVLDLELNSGGIFDSATAITQQVDGTITLKSNGCEQIVASYDITSAGKSGDITMGRVTSDNVPACEDLAQGGAAQTRRVRSGDAANTKAEDGMTFNAGFNDAWRNPEKKGGQGVLAVVLPTIESIFMAWFTYDTEQPMDGIDYTIGHPSQRWYTAFGPYDGDTAVLDLELNSNGMFDSTVKQTQVTDGTVTLKAIDCEEMLLSFDILSADQQGDIPLGRVVADNVERCNSLAAQEGQGSGDNGSE